MPMPGIVLGNYSRMNPAGLLMKCHQIIWIEVLQVVVSETSRALVVTTGEEAVHLTGWEAVTTNRHSQHEKKKKASRLMYYLPARKQKNTRHQQILLPAIPVIYRPAKKWNIKNLVLAKC